MVDLKNILKLAKSSYKELIKENKQYITSTKQQQCWQQQQQQQQYQQQKIYTRPKKYEKSCLWRTNRKWGRKGSIRNTNIWRDRKTRQ